MYRLSLLSAAACVASAAPAEHSLALLDASQQHQSDPYVLAHDKSAGAITLRSHKDAAAKILIVSHHKSGTEASWSLVLEMCCGFPKAGFRNIDAFFTYYFHNKCQDQCHAKGIAYYDNGGWPSFNPSLTLKTSTIVHFLRHPVDMVVSGYLYHLAGAESEWTDNDLSTGALKHEHYSKGTQLRFGSTADVKHIISLLDPHHKLKGAQGKSNQTYYKMLKAAPWKAGIAAEAHRTMAAGDGAGCMMALHKTLSESHRNVIPFCMNQYMPPGGVPRPPHPLSRPPPHGARLASPRSHPSSSPLVRPSTLTRPSPSSRTAGTLHAQQAWTKLGEQLHAHNIEPHRIPSPSADVPAGASRTSLANEAAKALAGKVPSSFPCKRVSALNEELWNDWVN